MRIHLSTTPEQQLVIDGLGRVVISVRIRDRDHHPGGCISCGRVRTVGLAPDRSTAAARFVLP